ncbi:hypothetical protein UFOVP1043_4 [uncultured Caudovirales phage]|uniref:Uncharacterized protein n=1 Tax=uncultured Caudovirales phage TaxID=2100421 RepID=A0A6J5QK78_9CAUD|nr:hypothetical protein UFOVP1043_4 [uncultured Caudovirales phage]
MANESKRYVQRGTTVADKAKLKYNPTALRDEPKGKSLSFRNDLSPKTSTGGSGGSNLIPRNKVDMASGNRNIGSQASNAKNIVPRGTSQPGPVRPETPSSARTMKDVQGSSRTVNRAITGPKSFVGPADLGKSTPKGSVGSTAGKFGKALGRAHGIGALLYSKDAGEGSDFKGTNDRPAPYSGLTLTGEDKKQEAPKASETKVPAPKVAVKSAPKGESQSGKDDRWKAYEQWVKTNRDPSTADYLKTGFGSKTPAADSGAQSRIDDNASFFKARQLASDNPGMKKGGKVKTKPMKAFAKGGSVRSASSRGDGCATKGHTKGAMR